ncbi:unnamed protein product [Soboliphyme baturini]|uniref:Molybdate-anion transporter n=1 Tax=Soboliphyme baturini TaxID=241478 RepID=A0A183IQC5_9BILA|nr:unnamed protein product [Soboliphyme baturini]
MEYNVIVNVFSFVLLVAALALHRWKGKGSRSGVAVTSTVSNADFVSFRNVFVIGHVGCLFAESLQAPFLYVLFNSYGYLESQIAVLYMSGLLVNIVFTMVTARLVQRVERRLLCCLCISLSCVACLLKLSQAYEVLLVSRALDGVVASLLLVPFHEWYLHEHLIRHDFPTEWIAVAFREVAVAHGFLAIVDDTQEAKGYFADMLVRVSGLVVSPFLMSVVFHIASGTWIFQKWPPNRLDISKRSYFCGEALGAIRVLVVRPKVLLLCTIQALFESTLCLFIFLWTPLLLPSRPLILDGPNFGVIFACFMASALLGTLLHHRLRCMIQESTLLWLSVSLSFIGMTAAVIISYPTATSVLRFYVLVVTFCLYEFGVGMYFPTMQYLQKHLLPAENRSALLVLVRVPLNALAVCGLLFLHSQEYFGNWMLMCFCMISLIIILMLSLLLNSLLGDAPTDSAHVFSHLSSEPDD